MTETNELRIYAEQAKSQIDRVVIEAEKLIKGRDSNTLPAEEIIYPSAEMLEPL